MTKRLDNELILRKGDVKRLQRRNLGSCRLPTCRQHFQEGDVVKRIGTRYYHFPECEHLAFMDAGEDANEEEVKA